MLFLLYLYELQIQEFNILNIYAVLFKMTGVLHKGRGLALYAVEDRVLYGVGALYGDLPVQTDLRHD